MDKKTGYKVLRILERDVMDNFEWIICCGNAGIIKVVKYNQI